MPHNLQRSLQLVLALLAGCLLPLAFAPFNYWLLAFFSPLILLALCHQQTPARAAWLGGLYGLGVFGVGVSWVFISIYEFGHTSMLAALLITCLFIGFLASYPALLGYLLQRYFSHSPILRNCLAFPSLWVLIEWLRSWLLTGFPWLLLGYSQINSPLSGFAPVLGGFGVAWLVTLSSGLLYSAWQLRKFNYWKPLLLLFILWLGGAAAQPINWTHAQPTPLTVSLIQGNIPQALKWTPDQVEPTLKRYQALSQAHWQSNLIIWPEAAVPLLKADAQDYLDAIDREAKRHHSALLLGLPTQEQDRYYNALIALGAGNGIYYKRHLVPLGEYLPINWLRGLLNFFAIPMPDFSAGLTKQPNLLAAGIKIAPFVCYEIAYSQLARSQLPEAELLVTVSNDAWFGHSFAAYQHLQIAQLRSLESGRYGLMSTNTGITAIITPKGQLQAIAPDFATTVLTSTIYAMHGTTPWVVWGDTPVLTIALLILIVLLSCKLKKLSS